jgi:thiosulfate/3-mercaptopyruvate sulfurtransferase
MTITQPPVVSPEWLTDHLPQVVVADVRWYLDGRSGYGAFLSGHLPGAVFVDLERYLAGPASAVHGRHPLPRPEVFAQGMAAVGITNSSQVVAYDDAGGAVAARLVWLLRVTGHDASVLDGGLSRWPGSLATGAGSTVPKGPFNLGPWPADYFADADEVGSAPLVIDARAPERFRGESEPIDPRPGHIPGARNVPTGANLDAQGLFKTAAELRRQYQLEGVSEVAVPIVYCGSGVSACHDLLALEQAGFSGRLFVGSWSQWSADRSRPAELGEASSKLGPRPPTGPARAG